MEKDIIVSLQSSDTSELTVEKQVTIFAGSNSANFTMEAQDDIVADGPQTVTITASASGYESATAEIIVNDNEGGSNDNNSSDDGGGTDDPSSNVVYSAGHGCVMTPSSSTNSSVCFLFSFFLALFFIKVHKRHAEKVRK
ncbi:MAG: hypothetical protein D6820_11780 [Lentisphaerae bacterium]|nr:MAG: hypothetical protein D6820_11780 [Lentisphaerota bacterium]